MNKYLAPADITAESRVRGFHLYRDQAFDTDIIYTDGDRFFARSTLIECRLTADTMDHFIPVEPTF